MTSPTNAVLNDAAYRLAPLKDISIWWSSDDNRWRFPAYGLLFAVVGLAVAGFASGRLDRALSRRLASTGLLVLATFALFAGRWPTFFVKDTLNHDESQALAQALTALHNPVPWMGFDGNTCGPLNTFMLDIPALFGFPLTFFSTRIIAVLCDAGAIAGLYSALSSVVSARVARIAMIAPLAYFELARDEHYVHYTGETLSLLLASLAVACVAWIYSSSRPRLAAVGLGLILGAMPLAKLQSVVMALAIALVGFAVAYARARSIKPTLRLIGTIAAATFAVPVIVLGWTFAEGGFYDFWMSYILSSIAYIQGPQPFTFLTATPEFSPLFDFAIVASLAGAVAIAIKRPQGFTKTQYVYLASIFLLGATVDAIYAPGRGSQNYLLFSLAPLGAAIAMSLAVVLELFPAPNVARFGVPALAVLTLAFAPTSSLYSSPSWLGSPADLFYSHPDPVVAMIERHVRAGERLAVWGWRPGYNDLTMTMTGTRDSITPYQEYIQNNPYYEYYRKRYYDDLETIRPKAFLDAGPNSFDFSGAGRNGHEDVPELAAEIRQMYHLVETTGQYRLYILNS